MRRLAVMMVVLAACATDGDICDPDQTYNAGLCYEVDSGAFTHFGDACKVDSDCAAPTTTCLRGADYCTATGCTSNEECPPYWSCLEQAGASELPRICIEP